MIIYRGVKDILFNKIDFLFKNSDMTFLDYGRGTSYSYERSLAEEYCSHNKKFAWLKVCEFSPKNELHITTYDFLDDVDFNSEEGFFIESEHVPRNEIAQWATSHGYDSIYFEYDESDPHILLLDNCDVPTLLELELHTENQEVVDKIKNFKFPFDGTIFKIPLNRIKEVDDLLNSLL